MELATASICSKYFNEQLGIKIFDQIAEFRVGSPLYLLELDQYFVGICQGLSPFFRVVITPMY